MACNVHFYKSVPDKKHMLEKQKKNQREQWRLRSSHTTCRRASLLTEELQVQRILMEHSCGTDLAHFCSGSWETWSQHHACTALHPVHWVFSRYELTQWFQNTHSPVWLKQGHKHRGFGCFVVLVPILLLQTRAREAGCKTALKQRLVWSSV